MSTIKSTATVSTHIGRSIEEVFDFITTAANWVKWHPATVSVSGDVDHPALEGETIVEVVRFGMARDRFAWKVEEREAPHRWVIRAKSERHGQKVKITYDLRPEAGGTHWEREMVFYLPGWFKYLDKLFINRALTRNSRKAVRQLKELLESH
ncbi:MAG: SRPBCC family protein [Actinomycetota bacterium]